MNQKTLEILERKCTGCHQWKDCIFHGKWICEGCFYERVGYPEGDEQ